MRLSGRRGVSWLSCLGLTCIMSAPATGQVPSATADSEIQQQTGHQRMVELLKRIHEETRVDNVYLGAGQIDKLRAALEALSGARPSPQRWSLHMQLGKHYLRLGSEAEGLEHYKKAYALIESVADRVPEKILLETLFYLGVATYAPG